MKNSSGNLPPTRAAVLLINSFFSYTIYYPPSTGFLVFGFWFCFLLPTGKCFICTVCNSYFSLPVTIWNRRRFLDACRRWWLVSSKKHIERVAKAAREPSPASPGTWPAGSGWNHSGDVSARFNSSCSHKKGQFFSLPRDALRMLQVQMVFRIHRTDRQWELPKWELDLNLAQN